MVISRRPGGGCSGSAVGVGGDDRKGSVHPPPSSSSPSSASAGPTQTQANNRCHSAVSSTHNGACQRALTHLEPLEKFNRMFLSVWGFSFRWMQVGRLQPVLIRWMPGLCLLHHQHGFIFVTGDTNKYLSSSAFVPYSHIFPKLIVKGRQSHRRLLSCSIASP